MSYIAIKTKIKAILDTIDPSILPVKYDYQETLSNVFPAGAILFVGSNERWVDDIMNEITATFVIKTVFPTEEGSQATDKWMTFLDTLTSEFRRDSHVTLTGSAVSFRITGTERSIHSGDYPIPVVVFDIGLEVKFTKNTNL